PGNSIEAVIWVAVGGRGTLTGAVLGAVLVNYGKTYFTSGVLAPYWLFVLGGLFVAVTLLLPRGIVGTIHQRWQDWRGRGGAGSARAPPPAPPGGGGGGAPPPPPPLVMSRGAPFALPASARSTISPSPSSPERCAPSSVPTAPAKPP